jgi:hypothetical protein
MGSSSDAVLDRSWLAGLALAIATGTWRTRILWPGRFVTVILLWLTAGALLCVGPSLAQATSSFYWYGENDSTCWQTGQLGSSSSACDSVGAGYLSAGGGLKGGLAHMDEVSQHGIGEDIGLTADGDYCNYYKVGDDITYQETNNQGGYTGYTTPTPYGNYQESDTHGDACQANGAAWGQEVRDEVKGNNCWETCGMHHYVSFHEQGLNDRPWASWFGEPSLVISAEANPYTFTPYGTKSVGAWGYVCPVLEDETTGDVLEYCLQEWRSKYNAAEWANERVASCSSGGGHNLDTLISMFYPGTQYATEYSGSANTFVLGSSGWRHYTAGITTSNLLNAINADNSHCLRGLSTNPANYALIGVEQGLEGWRELSILGGSSANLQISTAYQPKPPKATTELASNVRGEQATLHGTINPYGSDTHYYFEYGTTTSYGSTAPAPPGDDAGYGTSSVPASTTINNLEPETTYHDRLVASSSAGTSYGSDSTFTTTMSPQPAAYLDESTQDVYFRGTNSEMWQWQWEASPHKWYLTPLGGSVAGNISAFVGHGGDQFAYYRGTNGAIWEAYWDHLTKSWSLAEVGGSAAGDPVALINPTTEEQYVYFRGTNGAIWELYWEPGPHRWSLGELGGSADGNPTAYINTGGVQSVYFRGTNNAIWEWEWEPSPHKWYLTQLGGSATGSNLTAFVGHNTDQFVYYHGTNGAIWEAYWDHLTKSWSLAEVGGSAAGDPVALINPTTEEQYVYFRGTNGAIWELYWEPSPHRWSLGELGGSAGG